MFLLFISFHEFGHGAMTDLVYCTYRTLFLCLPIVNYIYNIAYLIILFNTSVNLSVKLITFRMNNIAICNCSQCLYYCQRPSSPVMSDHSKGYAVKPLMKNENG